MEESRHDAGHYDLRRCCDLFLETDSNFESSRRTRNQSWDSLGYFNQISVWSGGWFASDPKSVDRYLGYTGTVSRQRDERDNRMKAVFMAALQKMQGNEKSGPLSIYTKSNALLNRIRQRQRRPYFHFLVSINQLVAVIIDYNQGLEPCDTLKESPHLYGCKAKFWFSQVKDWLQWNQERCLWPLRTEAEKLIKSEFSQRNSNCRITTAEWRVFNSCLNELV